MEDVEGDTGTEVESISLSQLLAEADALPLHTSVVSGIICGRESLPCQDITALYVEEATVVQFQDGHGRSFSESVSLDACRFKLLPELEANDGKTYATVRHVMENANRLPSMVRALSGYSLDEVGSEDVVEPNEVFEVGTARLTRNDTECVIWFRVNNIQHQHGDDDAIATVQAAASSSTSSSSPGREPIVIPLDADCEFHTSVDNRHHALKDIVGMVRKGLLQIPVRLQVTNANVFGPSPSLPPKVLGRKFTVTGLPTKRSVVATDGADVFRIPESLCDRVRVSDAAVAMGLGVALRTVTALSQCVDDRRVRTVGPPEPASISSQATLNSASSSSSSSASSRHFSNAAASGSSLGAANAVTSPQHFKQRFSKSLRNRDSMAASSSSAMTSSSPSRAGAGISRSKTMVDGLVRRAAPRIEPEDEYVEQSAGNDNDTGTAYCVVPERKPAGFRTSRASTALPLELIRDARPAAVLPGFPAAEVPPASSQARSDPYEDIQTVRYGYSALRPGQDVPLLNRAATNAGATGGGFDEQNYALMTSGTAMAAHTSTTATSNDSHSNLYSNEPKGRRTHEAVFLPPKLPAKKKLSAPALHGAVLESENLYQTPPSSCHDTPSLRASDDNLYRTVVSSRPSSRSGTAQQRADDALYSTPSSSPMPVRKSKSQPYLATLSTATNTAIAPQPLYVNNATDSGTVSGDGAEMKKPTPKPRRGLGSKALEPAGAASPWACPAKPPRVRGTPTESGYASSPTSPMYSNTGQAHTSATGPDPYVQLESFQRISDDLEKARRHLLQSEGEVQSLKSELARCKAACHCLDDAQRREATSYEFTVPRNLPKSSTAFIGRDSTV